MSKKTGWIIAPAKEVKEAPKHDMKKAAQQLGGASLSFIEDEFFPGQGLVMHVRRIDRVPKDFVPYVEAHKHDVAQFYAATDGLTLEVTLEGEPHKLVGPATVFIPAGMAHTLRPLSGKGYLLVLLKKGIYNTD